MDNKVLFVKGTTGVGSLAGSIVNAVNATKGNVSIRSVGAGSLNQAMKAIILANKQFGKVGFAMLVSPDFVMTQEPSGELTVIELTLIKTATQEAVSHG